MVCYELSKSSPLGAVNLRNTSVSLHITHHFLTYYTSICFFVYYLSPPLGCKHLKVMNFISQYMPRVKKLYINHCRLLDYGIQSPLFSHFLSSILQGPHGTLRAAYRCHLLLSPRRNQPGMSSASLRPQSQLVEGWGCVSKVLSTLPNHPGAFTNT